MRRLRRVLSIFTLKRILIFSVISLAVWLLVSVVLAAGAFFYGQQNQAQSADVIIVLGSGLRRDGSPGDALFRRSTWAAQKWAEGYAPYVICTGGLTSGQSRSEADACKEVLINNGVKESAIYLENRSRSTEENAMYSKEIMGSNAWQDAVVVTDSFHMLRAHWIFNQYDIENYPSPVPIDWMRKSWYVRNLTREVIAMQWQAFKTTLNLPYTYVPIG